MVEINIDIMEEKNEQTLLRKSKKLFTFIFKLIKVFE